MNTIKKYLSLNGKHSEMAKSLFSFNILSELNYHHYNNLIPTSDYTKTSVLIELLGYDIGDSKKYKEFVILLKKEKSLYPIYVNLNRIGLLYKIIEIVILIN